MPEDSPNQPHDLVAKNLPEFLEKAASQNWPIEREHLVQRENLDDPQSSQVAFRVAFGHKPIQLGNVEFRILLFLASRPYHAFTRREIAKAVEWDRDVVTEAQVDEHITSLRDQLGLFNDYVQTVPYIGYRFKA